MNYPKNVFSLFLLAFLPVVMMAQYPTSVGTKWEYFQFFEDNPHPMAIMSAFSDSVVGDTIISSFTYHKVERKGRMYSGSGLSSNYDTIDANYFYRVEANRVLAFESTTGSAATERMVHDFSLSPGDTLLERPIDLICLSPQSQHKPILKYYHPDTTCAQGPFCDSILVLQTVLAQPPYTPAGLVWDPYRNTIFENNIGTLYSHPLIVVLDVYGQQYYLGKLTSDGNTLYEHPMLAMSVDPEYVETGMTLSPNPAQARLKVDCEKAFESLQILDFAGRELRNASFGQASFNAELSVSELPRGTYFLILHGEGWKSSKRLILN